jgi:hypothetical protein
MRCKLTIFGQVMVSEDSVLRKIRFQKWTCPEYSFRYSLLKAKRLKAKSLHALGHFWASTHHDNTICAHDQVSHQCRVFESNSPLLPFKTFWHQRGRKNQLLFFVYSSEYIGLLTLAAAIKLFSHLTMFQGALQIKAMFLIFLTNHRCSPQKDAKKTRVERIVYP